MSSRRGFLASLMGAMVLDPERLLWVPGAKRISIPKPVPFKWIRDARMIKTGGEYSNFNVNGCDLGQGSKMIVEYFFKKVPLSDPRPEVARYQPTFRREAGYEPSFDANVGILARNNSMVIRPCRT